MSVKKGKEFILIFQPYKDSIQGLKEKKKEEDKNERENEAKLTTSALMVLQERRGRRYVTESTCEYSTIHDEFLDNPLG